MSAINRIIFITIATPAVLFVVHESFGVLEQLDLHAGRTRSIYTFAGFPYSTTESTTAILSDAYAKIDEPLPDPLWTTTVKHGLRYSTTGRPTTDEHVLLTVSHMCDTPGIDDASIRKLLATTIELLDRDLVLSVQKDGDAANFYVWDGDDARVLATVKLAQ